LKLRIFLPAVGVLMVFAGVFGDSIGLNRGSGFGYGQFSICLTGIVLIVAGIAGRRFPAVYKRASLVLMNTMKWPRFCRQLEGRFVLNSGGFMVSGFPG